MTGPLLMLFPLHEMPALLLSQTATHSSNSGEAPKKDTHKLSELLPPRLHSFSYQDSPGSPAASWADHLLLGGLCNYLSVHRAWHSIGSRQVCGMNERMAVPVPLLLHSLLKSTTHGGEGGK